MNDNSDNSNITRPKKERIRCRAENTVDAEIYVPGSTPVPTTYCPIQTDPEIADVMVSICTAIPTPLH